MDIVTIVLVLIAVGVFAFISTIEREWEFVVLKSMGYGNSSIQIGALWETLLLTILGILLGIPIGQKFAVLFNDTFKSLIAPPPVNLNPALILSRAGLVIAISLATVYSVIRFTLKHNVAEKLRQVFAAL